VVGSRLTLESVENEIDDVEGEGIFGGGSVQRRSEVRVLLSRASNLNRT
jgi:hypothetical protein